MTDSGLIPNKGLDLPNINPFRSKVKVQSLTQDQGTIGIGTLLNRNKECQSVIILSSSNCFRISPFNGSKYNNTTKELDPLIPIRDLLGPTFLLPLGLKSKYRIFIHLTVY